MRSEQMTLTDPDGHNIPITGYWCHTCGLPMHHTNVPYGTHPTCDPNYTEEENS